MAKINLPTIEELKALYAQPKSSFDPTKITKAYETGTTLEDTIASKALERQKAEEDLKKEILAAKELAKKKQLEQEFVKAAQTPLTKPKPFRDVTVPKESYEMSLSQTQPLAEVVGRKAAEAGMVQDINQLQEQRRLEEQQRVDAANQPINLRNAAIAQQPDVAAKAALGIESDISARQMQLEKVDLPGIGPTYINVDKINKKVYDLQGNDITQQVKGAIPSFAPAMIMGTSGVYGIPRKQGTFRAAEGVEPGQLITSTAQLQPTESSILEKTKEDFNTDPTAKVALAKQGDYEMADAVIGIGNWVGDAAVLSVAAKGLGRDVGNLSQEEQRRYRMSPQLLQMIKTQANLWAKGIIRPEDRDAFKEAVRVMKLKNIDILNEKRELYGNLATSRIPNIDPEWAKSYIYEPSSLDQFNSPGMPEQPGTPENSGAWTAEKEAKYQMLLKKRGGK